MRYEDLPRDEKTKGIEFEKLEFPIVYPLLTPLKISGIEAAEIEIREPTVTNLADARKVRDGIGSTVRLLCSVADLSEDEARALGTRDFKRLSEVLESFL